MSTLVTEKPVLVTGGNGFIAAHIIKQLLEKGYRVRATVRKVSDPKNNFLRELDAEGTKLELVEADLMTEGAFDAAVVDLEYVIHVASPFILNVRDPQKDLVDPAVNGTRSILEASRKAKTVKRVVITSSEAAITDSPIDGYTYTESDWNTLSSLTRNPYYYSKTLAENAAWVFVEALPEGEKFEVVVINPCIVIGPALSKEAAVSSQSTSIIKQLCDGTFPGIIRLAWGMVDVRDVAKAHILAIENPKANGRYLVCAESIWMKDAVADLKTKFPGLKLPSMNLTGSWTAPIVYLVTYMQPPGVGMYLRTHLNVLPKFDHSKATGETLGLTFIPLKTTLSDAVENLISYGILKPKK